MSQYIVCFETHDDCSAASNYKLKSRLGIIIFGRAKKQFALQFQFNNNT